MDVLEAIYERRAIRDFTDEAPSRELIAEVVADAVQAPNSINRQAWAFFVLQDRARLAAASAEVKKDALGALPEAARAGMRPFLENPDFNVFYNAPALVVICATLVEPMVAQDCCLAAQTLMLAAHARRLGTCWIGFAEGWLGRPEVKRELGIPPSYVPVAPIIIGRPRTVPQPPGRKAPAITWIGETALTAVAAG